MILNSICLPAQTPNIYVEIYRSLSMYKELVRSPVLKYIKRKKLD